MFAPAKDANMFALTQSADQSGIRTSDMVMNIVAPQGSGGGLGGMLGGQSGGAMLGSMAGMAGQFLPPQARPLLSAGGFVMNGGLSGLISGNVGALMGLGGIASQFLPPYASDALMAGQMLMSGASPMQMMQGLMGRFLPPELQGVWAAAQSVGGLQGMFPSLSSRPTIADTPSLPPDAGGIAPFAARVTDQHICPMSEGPKPHVGGPILPLGCPTVLIGNLPAARQGDKAFCVGSPDTIQKGEETVLIGNKEAARLGDPTEHCGIITNGYATVWIGKSLAGTSRCIQIATENSAATVVGPEI